MFREALLICLLRRARHNARMRVRARERYLENPEKVRLANKKWAAENPEKVNTIKRAWKERNIEKARAASRESNKRNRERCRECAAVAYNTRPEVRILSVQRVRLRRALKGQMKSAKTLELIGCPAETLKRHLETQFRPGMCWENYGLIWEIDHKKPCAKFDLSKPEQQRACFHYTNLQPLFAEENARKRDFYL